MNSYFRILGTEPKPADFGITAEEYNKFLKGHNPWHTPLQIVALILAVIADVIVEVTNEKPFDWSFISVAFVIWISLAIFVSFISEFLPRHRKFKLYKEALADFYRTQENYWMSLKGEDLEYMLADLYRKLGYKVELTSRTGDKGVDLLLYKDNQTTIVQCKGHRNPVGPAVVRELFGTLKSSIANNAILVSPAGFTRGAKQTAAGKAIQLISSRELVAMVKVKEPE